MLLEFSLLWPLTEFACSAYWLWAARNLPFFAVKIRNGGRLQWISKSTGHSQIFILLFEHKSTDCEIRGVEPTRTTPLFAEGDGREKRKAATIKIERKKEEEGFQHSPSCRPFNISLMCFGLNSSSFLCSLPYWDDGKKGENKIINLSETTKEKDENGFHWCFY